MKAGRLLFQPPIGFSREIQDKESFEYLLSCMSHIWQSLCPDPYFRLEEVILDLSERIDVLSMT